MALAIVLSVGASAVGVAADRCSGVGLSGSGT